MPKTMKYLVILSLLTIIFAETSCLKRKNTMEIDEFWKKYFSKSSKSSFLKLRRDQGTYYGTYEIPLSEPDRVGIIWETKEETAIINRSDVEQYDYYNDPRFITPSNLNQICKEIISNTIIYKSEKINRKLLVKILQKKFGFIDSLDNPIHFLDSITIQPDILINDIQGYLKDGSLFTNEEIESEVSFALFVLTQLRTENVVQLALDILEAGQTFIVNGAIEYDFLNICEMILKNAFDINSIRRIYDYIENGSRTERVRFGKVLNFILSSNKSISLDDIGGEFDSNEARQKWRKKIDFLANSDLKEQWNFFATSVYWERRLISIKNTPQTRDGIEGLLTMLQDEILPVKLQAMIKLHEYIDLTSFYQENNLLPENEDVSKILTKYLTNNLDRLEMNRDTGKFSL